MTSFEEKPDGDGAWINGGFFVLEPAVLNYIKGDEMAWEGDPLQILAQKRELSVYRHRGFWRPMDTLRDKNELESLWSEGRAPGNFGNRKRVKHQNLFGPPRACYWAQWL